MKFRKYELQTFKEDDAIRLEDRLHKHVHAENILKRNEESPEKGLYDLLSVNEFDVIEKQITKLQHPLLSKLPKFAMQLLIGGEEIPLIAIHDFFMNRDDYLVMSARDLTSANYSGRTSSSSNVNEYEKELDIYLSRIAKLHYELDYEALTNFLKCINISLRGPIQKVLDIRKMLRTGFSRLKIVSDSISYS